MHHNEKWQLFSANGEPIASEWWNAERGNPGGEDMEIVGIVTVFLYRRGVDGVELLWQKRSEQIDRYPGDWDISAGGHVNLGESLVEAAVREAREEIGAEIAVDDLRLVTMRPHNKNRLAWVYLVDWTGRECDFHFDDQEVSEVKWVTWKGTESFVQEHAKAPLKKDKLTFGCLEEWFEAHGDL